MALSDAGVEVKIDVIPDCKHQSFVTVVDSKMDLTDMRRFTTEGMGWLLRWEKEQLFD